jgi:hypothetical protein
VNASTKGAPTCCRAEPCADATSDDGATFGGTFELNEDEAGWNDDLKITYRRAGA